MKKIAFALVLLSATLGFSQESDDELFSAVLEEQIETLELSGEKKDAFVDISTKYNEKMKTIRAGDGSKMSKFKEFKSLQDEKNKELKELLSKEEYQALLELQKENRNMLKDRYKQQSKS
nr:hypothetical protein [Allomuricauda sp.]